MPKGAPAKLTATSRPEAPAAADTAASTPVPEAEEGVTNAETSPNLQAVPSPCNTSNRNDENECALNDLCNCVECTIQTYKDLKDSNATYQTTKEALNHVKELIAGFGVYSDPDLGTLGLPPLDNPGGMHTSEVLAETQGEHAGICYRQGKTSTDPQGRYHEKRNINFATYHIKCMVSRSSARKTAKALQKISLVLLNETTSDDQQLCARNLPAAPLTNAMQQRIASFLHLSIRRFTYIKRRPPR